jgi:hypothetical protein
MPLNNNAGFELVSLSRVSATAPDPRYFGPALLQPPLPSYEPWTSTSLSGATLRSKWCASRHSYGAGHAATVRLAACMRLMHAATRHQPLRLFTQDASRSGPH